MLSNCHHIDSLNQTSNHTYFSRKGPSMPLCCPIHTLASAYLVTESQYTHFLLIVSSTYAFYCTKSTHAYTSPTYITRYIIILRYISVCVLTFVFSIIFDRFTFMVSFGEKIYGRMAYSSNLMAT